MLKKPLKEGDKLEIGKAYCFPNGSQVSNISSKSFRTMLCDNVIFRITNIQTAKKWSIRTKSMSTQYIVTIQVIDVIHDPSLLSRYNSKSVVSQKFVDNVDEYRIHLKYALAVDSKKVLADLMEG